MTIIYFLIIMKDYKLWPRSLSIVIEVESVFTLWVLTPKEDKKIRSKKSRF